MIDRLSKKKSQKATASVAMPAAAKPSKKRASQHVPATRVVGPVEISNPPAPVIAAVPSFIEQLQAGDWKTRARAAAGLGSLADRTATPALIRALRDLTVEVSQEAVTALGAIKDSAAVDALSAVVINAELYFDPQVRAAAAGSLAQISDRRAVDALLIAVRDPMAAVSQAAIRALAALGDERAVETLFAVVRNRDGYFLPATRSAAVEALRHFTNPTALEFLRSISGNN